MHTMEGKYYYLSAVIVVGGRVGKISTCIKDNHPLIWAQERSLARISAGDGFPDGPTSIEFFHEIDKEIYERLAMTEPPKEEGPQSPIIVG